MLTEAPATLSISPISSESFKAMKKNLSASTRLPSREYTIPMLLLDSATVCVLQEVGDYEALNCLPALNLIRSTGLHLTTEPPIFCRCCYKLWFFSLVTMLLIYLFLFTLLFGVKNKHIYKMRNNSKC